MKKYKLTDETIIHAGRVLYRIEALRDFGLVKVGDKGGWIETENNLSHKDNCWVDGEAKVFGNSYVLGNALIVGNAQVFECAMPYGNAYISDNAQVFGVARVEGAVGGESKVYGDAWILGIVANNSEVYDSVILDGAYISDVEVGDDREYMVFMNPVTHTYITWTKSNDWWIGQDISMSSNDLINEYGKEHPEFSEYFKTIAHLVHTIH